MDVEGSQRQDKQGQLKSEALNRLLETKAEALKVLLQGNINLSQLEGGSREPGLQAHSSCDRYSPTASAKGGVGQIDLDSSRKTSSCDADDIEMQDKLKKLLASKPSLVETFKESARLEAKLEQAASVVLHLQTEFEMGRKQLRSRLEVMLAEAEVESPDKISCSGTNAPEACCSGAADESMQLTEAKKDTDNSGDGLCTRQQPMSNADDEREFRMQTFGFEASESFVQDERIQTEAHDFSIDGCRPDVDNTIEDGELSVGASSNATVNSADARRKLRDEDEGFQWEHIMNKAVSPQKPDVLNRFRQSVKAVAHAPSVRNSSEQFGASDPVTSTGPFRSVGSDSVGREQALQRAPRRSKPVVVPHVVPASSARSRLSHSSRIGQDESDAADAHLTRTGQVTNHSASSSALGPMGRSPRRSSPSVHAATAPPHKLQTCTPGMNVSSRAPRHSSPASSSKQVNTRSMPIHSTNKSSSQQFSVPNQAKIPLAQQSGMQQPRIRTSPAKAAPVATPKLSRPPPSVSSPQNRIQMHSSNRSPSSGCGGTSRGRGSCNRSSSAVSSP